MICPYCLHDIKFIDNMECCSGDEVECDDCHAISEVDYDELPTDTDWGNVGFYYLIKRRV